MDDLRRLHDFLAEHDPGAVRSAVANLKRAITRFADQPRMGHPVEDIEGVREFVFGRYVVRYMVRPEAVYILRIWHGREFR